MRPASALLRAGLAAATLGAAAAQSLGISFPFNISNTLSDHVVLQRAPQAAVVWGFGTQFAPVTVALFAGNGSSGGAPAVATVSGWVSSLGVWRLSLPPMPAGGPFTIVANSTQTKEGAVVSDVLFGDVVVCGGRTYPRRDPAPTAHHPPPTAHSPPAYPGSKPPRHQL